MSAAKGIEAVRSDLAPDSDRILAATRANGTAPRRNYRTVTTALDTDLTSASSFVDVAAASAGAGITATVTSLQTSQQMAPATFAQASSAADRRKFLESVLAWPGSPQASGWINVHVNSKNERKPGEPTKNGGKPWVTGWPFKTVDEVLNRISWVESTADFFNVWVCIAAERMRSEGERQT
ncbi:hypothetical protein [Bradyrhizobium sp. Tv2a-2]|uniref:hypothetical protein n=1 Tax=Bradyrhizobium sp. Tv2a-2 TaxID=113395 RepID=UPI0005625A7D|nr:hypothetical protein [Bradyrhizobium sp. Tv2a-2]